MLHLQCACGARQFLNAARAASTLVTNVTDSTSCSYAIRQQPQQLAGSSRCSSGGDGAKGFRRLGAVLTGAALWAASATSSGTTAVAEPSHAAEEGDKSLEFKLLPLHMRQRIFFKYEKRIRELSSLEKVFEYFSTQEEEGVKFMTMDDVARSLIPTYPPAASVIERAGSLDGEHRDHALTSSSTKRLVSFPEYVVTVLLLSIPEDEVHAVFDLMDMDDSGTLDAEEFLQVINALERRAGIQDKFVSRVGRHQHTTSRPPQAVIHKLFGADGTNKLQLPKFRSFLQGLHEDMVRSEFRHYDATNQGWISGTDFARSLVTPAEVRIVDQLLDKADALPAELAGSRIRLAEFKEVAAMRRKLYDVGFALKFCRQVGRPVTRADFTKLLKKVSGLKLSPVVQDILFALFADSNGDLDSALLVDVLQRRDKLPGRRLLTPTGTSGVAQDQPAIIRWWNCVMKCTEDGQSSGPA